MAELLLCGFILYLVFQGGLIKKYLDALLGK